VSKSGNLQLDQFQSVHLIRDYLYPKGVHLLHVLFQICHIFVECVNQHKYTQPNSFVYRVVVSICHFGHMISFCTLPAGFTGNVASETKIL
jgi:hypothetical protein